MSVAEAKSVPKAKLEFDKINNWSSKRCANSFAICCFRKL